MTEFNRTLVVGDGGLAAIVACAAAADAALLAEPDTDRRRAIRPILWAPPFVGQAAPAQRWAVRRQAEFFEMDLVESAPRIRTTDPTEPAESSGEHHWSDDSLWLLSASKSAIDQGCGRVSWPVHSSHATCPDLDEVARAADRALLVSRLIRLDACRHGDESFRVEVPLVDFSDRQMADLVIDMDLPVRLCWWWHAEMAPPGTAEFRHERDRWLPVLRDAGWNEGASSPASPRLGTA